MSYTALYIANTDITDSVARDFINGTDARLDTWMQNTDENLKALAMSLGIQTTDIYTPVNYFVKEYCIAYYCFQVFQDCFGENAPEVNENDIYKIKLEYYKNRVNELRTTITKEMLYQVATSLDSTQWVTSGMLYRA